MAPIPPKVEAQLKAYNEGRELPPSDPPTRAPHLSEAEIELARAAGVPGFGTALKHIKAGAERLGGRVSVLIALAGGAGVVESTVATYLHSIKSDKELNAEAAERAWKEDVTKQLTSLNTGVGGFGATVSRVSDDQRLVSNQVSGVIAKQAKLEGWAQTRGFK